MGSHSSELVANLTIITEKSTCSPQVDSAP